MVECLPWNKGIYSKKKEVKANESYIQSSIEPVEFVSSVKRNVKLSDIFVWPKFKLINLNGTEETIEGSIKIFTARKKCFSIVKGIELSGKTSILKKCFIDSLNDNIYALVLDGESIYQKTDFDSVVSTNFKKQYVGSYSEFLKLDSKLIMIDNYHHKISQNLLIWAKEKFNYVLALIQEEEYMLYYKDDEQFADFNIYTIKNFDKSKTFEIINKWKSLDRSCCMGTEEFDRVVDDMEEKLRSIINQNHIVPSYPFYILSVLQIFEGFLPSDYQITSYGHCYNALITSQLLKKNINPNDLGDCFNFLTYIAFNMFSISMKSSEGDSTFSYEDYDKIKQNYKDDFLIKDTLITRIENSDYPILRVNTTVRFEYPYIYYYYVGKYLADKGCIDIISWLCETIYNKKSANILIFTIHHTTNNQLLDEIQLHCMLTFDSKETAKLTTDETEFMNSLIIDMPKQLINRNSVEENRKEVRKQQDNSIATIDSHSSVEFSDANKELIDIHRSQKIIEVLGQIIKNRAGTFDKKRIKELTIEVEELGFRLLKYLLNNLKDHDFQKWMEARLKAVEKEKFNDGKEFNDEARKACIEKNIQFIGMAVIFSVLNKIFYSICTDKIISIQEQISMEKNVPAYDFLHLLFKLGYQGIQIEEARIYFKKYNNEKNNWASKTLSILLQHYINTHNVHYQIRQKICDLLRIPYIPNKNT